jgi:hypothetical protein
MLVAIVRQIPMYQIQPEQADRDVDEEDDPPVKGSNDEAATWENKITAERIPSCAEPE